MGKRILLVMTLMSLQGIIGQSVLHKNFNVRASHLVQRLNAAQDSLFLSSYRGIDSLSFIPRGSTGVRLYDKGYKVGVDLKQFPNAIYTVCVYQQGSIMVLNVEINNAEGGFETKEVIIAKDNRKVIPFGKLYYTVGALKQTRSEFKRSHQSYNGGQYVNGVQEECMANLCPQKKRHFKEYTQKGSIK